MQKQVKFNYVYDKDYSPEYFTGILSSISVQEELLLNFYLERTALPKMETFNIKEDGNLEIEPFQSIPSNNNEVINMVRHIKSGIILDLEGAKELKSLLENYLSIIENNCIEEKKEDKFE